MLKNYYHLNINVNKNKIDHFSANLTIYASSLVQGF